MKKFTYDITWSLGEKRPVQGYRLSEHFATRREWDGSWMFTHLPTGLAIYACTTRTLKHAVRIAAKVERVRDWSTTAQGSDVPLRDKYAVVKIAKGKAYADQWLAKEKHKARERRARKRKAA